MRQICRILKKKMKNLLEFVETGKKNSKKWKKLHVI